MHSRKGRAWFVGSVAIFYTVRHSPSVVTEIGRWLRSRSVLRWSPPRNAGDPSLEYCMSSRCDVTINYPHGLPPRAPALRQRTAYRRLLLEVR